MEMICVSVERLQTTPWSIFFYYNRNYENELKHIYAHSIACARARAHTHKHVKCEKHQRIHNDHAMRCALPPASASSCHAMQCERIKESCKLTQTHGRTANTVNEFSLPQSHNARLKWNCIAHRRGAMYRMHNNENFKCSTCSRLKLKHSTEIPRDYVLSRTRTHTHTHTLPAHITSLAEIFFFLFSAAATAAASAFRFSLLPLMKTNIRATSNNEPLLYRRHHHHHNHHRHHHHHRPVKRRKEKIPNPNTHTKFNNGIMKNVNWCECMLVLAALAGWLTSSLDGVGVECWRQC